jgi:hypothetical protein
MSASRRAALAAAFAVALAAAPVTAQHEHGQPHAGAAGGGGTSTTRPAALATPSAMNAEHAHLHEQLADALAAGGKTADAARKVEAVLSKHFVDEEAYALPPLGLLEVLAQGKMPTPEQAKAAIEMTEKLRANYDQMLDEHRQLTRSLNDLEAAAEAEKKPKATEFARALALHAVNEEQVLYPAALLVGDYLKLRQAAGTPDHAPAHQGH